MWSLFEQLRVFFCSTFCFLNAMGKKLSQTLLEVFLVSKGAMQSLHDAFSDQDCTTVTLTYSKSCLREHFILAFAPCAQLTHRLQFLPRT